VTKAFLLRLLCLCLLVFQNSCEEGSSSEGPASSPREATLLFRSGFESGVILDPPHLEGSEWSQFMHGGDAGFAWENILSRGTPKNRFTYLVSSSKHLSEFANTRIETVMGRDGQPTQALMGQLIKQDPTLLADNTRNQYGFYPKATDTQAYMRYWIKLQPDLGTAVLPAGQTGSRQLMEWKEQGPPGQRSDFRWNINVKRSPGTPLYWWVNAQFGDLQDSPKAWECTSTVPVPLNEWFLLEVFWKLDTVNGRVWGAVNGQTFADFRGQTQKDDGLFVWWPFKVYVGGQLEAISNNPGYTSIYQWVDDVEVYDDIPSDASVPQTGTFTVTTLLASKGSVPRPVHERF